MAMFERAVAGERVADLAREARLSPRTLQRRWLDKGLSLRASRAALMEERLRPLRDRWRAGEPLEVLAREASTTPVSLRNMFSRRGWYHSDVVTARRLHALWGRHMLGESTARLAASCGRSSRWLTHHWRRLGYDPQAHKGVVVTHHRARMYITAWGLRVDGHTWPQIKERVGYPYSHRTLRCAVHRWRERNAISLPL